MYLGFELETYSWKGLKRTELTLENPHVFAVSLFQQLPTTEQESSSPKIKKLFGDESIIRRINRPTFNTMTDQTHQTIIKNV